MSPVDTRGYFNTGWCEVCSCARLGKVLASWPVRGFCARTMFGVLVVMLGAGLGKLLNGIRQLLEP